MGDHQGSFHFLRDQLAVQIKQQRVIPVPTLSPALSQVLSLPLLTTKKPRKLRIPKKNVQKNVIDEFGPFEGHFIAPPQLNAGALPLATNEDLPLFPPFNNIKRDKENKDDEN